MVDINFRDFYFKKIKWKSQLCRLERQISLLRRLSWMMCMHWHLQSTGTVHTVRSVRSSSVTFGTEGGETGKEEGKGEDFRSLCCTCDASAYFNRPCF